MHNDPNFASAAMKDICNDWIRGEIYFEDPESLNSAYGWIYFNIGVQNELNAIGGPYFHYQPAYISPADMASGYALNAGHPFKIGTTISDRMNA